MTSSETRAEAADSAHRLGPWSYWALSAPFLLIFIGSVALTFADLEATRAATVENGFPEWAAVPQGVAKVLGLVAVLSRRSPLLTGLAFAGFFYDTLLALGAHLVQHSLPDIALASAGALATAAAWYAYHRRYQPGRAR